MKSRALKIVALSAALASTATLLSACTPIEPMEAAENANDPACANVIVRLPDVVAGEERRYTNAQATGAWGDGAVQLVCGVEPTGPTTDTCVNVNGVDWVIDESAAPIYRFEPYGRSPGLAVYVDSDQVSGTETAVDLGAVVQQLPQERQCTTLSDTFDVPDAQQ
ncbi:DUF3515 family protein [Leucobacter chromiiresistens]|uniref:DUF3515 domain-containing protein n=1 Tax=Leucobacter chromiiresistens TaxID=1079994 RepID=A0A147ER71_9MICO|nr:DUF3515 family protein [Leucobacter chromiiresistens]KTR86917.1 hypothetical protein NS354_02945 [Leucobacter chromiiresistens]